MALSHAVPGQIFDVRPLGAELPQASSVAVFKSEQLEVLRVVLLAGRCFPEHQVAGEITVQCLEGVIEVSALGRVQQLRAGDMLFLAGRQPHALVALEDASALMTICLSQARAG